MEAVKTSLIREVPALAASTHLRLADRKGGRSYGRVLAARDEGGRVDVVGESGVVGRRPPCPPSPGWGAPQQKRRGVVWELHIYERD